MSPRFWPQRGHGRSAPPGPSANILGGVAFRANSAAQSGMEDAFCLAGRPHEWSVQRVARATVAVGDQQIE